MKIRNKKESLNYIKMAGLNHFGEINFKRNDFTGVKKFLKKYDVPYYFLRELIPSTKNVFYNLSKKEVLEKISEFEAFGLDVSSLNFIDNQLICAEVKIGKDNSFMFSGSTNKNSTHREFLKPNYFFNTDIFDKRVRSIPYIHKIIDYVYKNELFDMIIELCVFDIPVGIKKEEIIVYEVRTEY